MNAASVRFGTITSAFPQSFPIATANSGVKPGYNFPLSAITGSTKIKLFSVLKVLKIFETISSCSKEPKYPVYNASKVIFCCFQCSVMLVKSEVKSLKVKPLNAVWVDKTAVGKTEVSMPNAEMTGRATVSEHLPTQEISRIVKILCEILKKKTKKTPQTRHGLKKQKEL